MNPLNRKMFRQPGMSRQPMGILASSPELANVVRRRMGQPVQMVHGGYHPPRSPMGRLTTSRRPVPGDVRIPVIDALPKSGFARPALDDFLTRSSAARAKAPGVAIPSGGLGSLSSPPVMSVRGAGDTASTSGIMDMIRRAIPDAKGSKVRPTDITDFELPKTIVSEEDSPNERLLASEILGGRRDAQFMGDTRDPNLDVNIGVGVGKTGLGVEPPIEDQVVLPRRVVSEEDSPEEGAVRLKSPMPIPKSKPEREASKENLMGTEQDAQFMQDPMSIVDMVRNAQDDPKNKTDKQKAAATDSVLNVKNLKERKALLKSLLGEEKAKDIRTDAGYNLMMTGLMIAAGTSPDAMTNIARGLAGGLKGYGTATGEEAQAEKKLDRELSLLAYSELSDEQKAARAAQVAEDARIKERAFQSSETDKKLAFQKAENALSRFSQKELKELGLENAFKIAELSADSRRKIEELNRKNQMAIAQLPSGEIRGLLQIYGDDNEKVQEYLEAKNKLKSKDTDTDDLTASLTRIIEGEGTAADTARLLASPAGQKAIQNAGNITDAASELLETTTEDKGKRGDRKNKPNDGFGEVTTTN